MELDSAPIGHRSILAGTALRRAVDALTDDVRKEFATNQEPRER